MTVSEFGTENYTAAQLLTIIGLLDSSLRRIHYAIERTDGKKLKKLKGIEKKLSNIYNEALDIKV